MKDLGDLHYFVVVQVVRTPSGLFLSLHKYIFDLFRKFHLHTVKPVRTPVVYRVTWSLLDKELLANSTDYRSMVGAFQYLAMNHPDIAYVVNMVSQFMHAPRTTHLHDVQNFRYLHGTLTFGLFLYSSSSPIVVIANSDAKWASCPNTCRSTLVMLFFLGRI